MIVNRWRQRGFTLVELLVGLGMLGLVMVPMGTVVGRAIWTQRGVADDGRALSELRRAMAYFAEDVKMAKAAEPLIDGGSPATSITLTWNDQYQGIDEDHTAFYAVQGNRLVRIYDGAHFDVAFGVTSVLFSLSGRTVTIQAVANTAPGVSRTISLESVMRPVAQ